MPGISSGIWRALAWGRSAFGAPLRVARNGYVHINTTDRSQTHCPGQHVRDFIRDRLPVIGAQRARYLTELLDQPPKCPVDPTTAVSNSIDRLDSLLKVGKLHCGTPIACVERCTQSKAQRAKMGTTI